MRTRPLICAICAICAICGSTYLCHLRHLKHSPFELEGSRKQHFVLREMVLA